MIISSRTGPSCPKPYIVVGRFELLKSSEEDGVEDGQLRQRGVEEEVGRIEAGVAEGEGDAVADGDEDDGQVKGEDVGPNFEGHAADAEDDEGHGEAVQRETDEEEGQLGGELGDVDAYGDHVELK
ncbi:hypothetical protein TYRP_008968 [Tyrophagus putrescentiae]|nr:hypothetical protein TYRP_008968 [Tyrophagus putrescentiae]